MERKSTEERHGETERRETTLEDVRDQLKQVYEAALWLHPNDLATGGRPLDVSFKVGRIVLELDAQIHRLERNRPSFPLPPSHPAYRGGPDGRG